jgi:hypothetical protein
LNWAKKKMVGLQVDKQKRNNKQKKERRRKHYYYQNYHTPILKILHSFFAYALLLKYKNKTSGTFQTI